MRILQITNSFYPEIGGQEKVVLELSKELVSKKNNVTILTSDWGSKKKLKEKEKYEGINIIRLKNNFWLGGYGYVFNMKSWLNKNYKSFDLVHCHGYNRYMAEFALKFLYRKIPLVFTPHGFIHTTKKIFFKKIHDLFLGGFISKANFCTALTRLDFKDYQRLGVREKKIIEIPNGADLSKFKKPKIKEIKNFKKRFKLNKKILLYVGRIHESKGIQYVLESIKNLDCKLLIVGPDTGFKKKLIEQSKREKIENKLIFAGKVNDTDLIKAYFSSDIFVLFSNWEGFGIVVLEAMAAGLPVVVSNRGALDLLINDQNGIKIKYPNVEDLKNQLNFLIKNKRERVILGKKAKFFAKNYSWKEITKKYEKIYRGLIKDEI